MREHHTICRACHAACGVIVAVEEGEPVSVRGNPDNPMYKGFCCVKGQNFAAQRNNPNRLLHSQQRQADGSYCDIPVEQAMDEIASRLTALREAHGKRSVALYSGTFWYPPKRIDLDAGAGGGVYIFYPFGL